MFDSVSSRANLQEYFSSPQLSLVYYFSDNLDHKKYLIVIHIYIDILQVHLQYIKKHYCESNWFTITIMALNFHPQATVAFREF